jgi:hypothetical protein
VAVWNGSNQEVGARKQLSAFLTLTFRQQAGVEWPQIALIAAILVVITGAVGVVWLRPRTT